MAYKILLDEELARRVEAAAASAGLPPEQYVMHVLSNDVKQKEMQAELAARPWMRYFGISHRLAAEVQKIDATIEDEFERLEDEDLA